MINLTMINLTKVRLTTISLIMTGLLSLMLSQASFAASECKGKSQAMCKAGSDCAWVGSYARKDGAKVKAHCKSKPSKKAVKDKLSSKKDKASDKVNKAKDSSKEKSKAKKVKKDKMTDKAKAKAKKAKLKDKASSSK